jgi:Fic family protein
MNELITVLQQQKTNEPAIVRAAMAHLNLAMIHPFEDGNGRMARELQTLILEREGFLNPVFSSIEEYLGRNTEEYYRVLAEVGGGSWKPNRNTRPWLRFCLKAHFECAQNFRTRNKAIAELWGAVQGLIEKHNVSGRTDFGLVWAALGYRITNSRYRSFVDVNENTASRDLKRLTDKGLLEARGERRGRAYIAGSELREAARLAFEKIAPDKTDPFSDFEPELPGLT